MLPPVVLLLGVTAMLASPGGVSKVQLVTDVQSVQPGQAITVGVILMPPKGWHTYWINSGDTGSPTKVVWHLPVGWKAGPVRWPAPRHLTSAGLQYFGYDNNTMLLADLTPPITLKLGARVNLSGQVKWVVCNEEGCVVGNGAFSVRLPVSASPPKINEAWHRRFVEAAQTVPSNLSGWTPKASLSTGSIVLNLKGAGPILEKPGSAYFFPQDVGVVSLSKPETFTLCQTGLVAHLPVSEYAQHAPTRLRGVLVAPPGMDWMGHGHAIAIDVPISSS